MGSTICNAGYHRFGLVAAYFNLPKGTPGRYEYACALCGKGLLSAVKLDFPPEPWQLLDAARKVGYISDWDDSCSLCGHVGFDVIPADYSLYLDEYTNENRPMACFGCFIAHTGCMPKPGEVLGVDPKTLKLVALDR